MTLKFPSDIGSQDSYFSLTIQKFKKFNTTDLKSATDRQASTQTIGSISLPVPKGLQTTNDVSWNGIGSITGKIADKGKSMLGGNAEFAAIEAGVTTNKPTQMAFDAVGIRRFSWTWNMIPRTAQEARDIENIIYQLEYAKLPEGPIAGLDAVYPYVIVPRLKGKNKMVKFLPCVINSLSVEYANGGDYIEYKDGGLPIYVITLQVSEMASMNKDVYRNMLGR